MGFGENILSVADISQRCQSGDYQLQLTEYDCYANKNSCLCQRINFLRLAVYTRLPDLKWSHHIWIEIWGPKLNFMQLSNACSKKSSMVTWYYYGIFRIIIAICSYVIFFSGESIILNYFVMSLLMESNLLILQSNEVWELLKLHWIAV